MAHGQWEGKTLDDKEVRGMFTRESLLNSDWYQARLAAKKEADEDAESEEKSGE